MKKNILHCVLLLAASNFADAQNVGIGTASPHSSAALEISGSNKGLLLPRVADTSSVSSPAKGLVIYSNNTNKLWFYDGGRWQQAMASAGGMDSIWYEAKDTIAYTTKPYIGINTDLSLIKPQANFQLNGSLLVQGKLEYSNSAPTAAQVYTMNNTGAQSIPISDSVFRIYDPGGTGNYNNGMQGNITTQGFTNQAGIRISSNAADWGFGTGDTLWISNLSFPDCRTDYAYRFTSSSTSPEDLIMPATSAFYLRFNFRSNFDGSNGKGFNFLITRLSNKSDAKVINTAGPALYFNTSTGGFSAGLNAEAKDSAVALGTAVRAYGNGSSAFGFYSKAFGRYSFSAGFASIATGTVAAAFGSQTEASGGYSFAAGGYSKAGGEYSTAFGYSCNASGYASTALGGASSASGFVSTALNGGNASGDYSIAAGNYTEASGYSSFAANYDAEAIGSYSTALGYGTTSAGYAGTVVGMYNNPLSLGPQTTISTLTPLFIVGNGDNNSDKSNALVVLKNGNVGIGMNAFPQTKLHISGGADASLSNTSGYMAIGDINSTNIVFDNNEILARNNGANSTLFLQNSGGAFEIGGTAAKPGGGSWSATSDARLKQNIIPYKDGLQQLLRINPVYYQYNQLSGYDSSKQYIGVMAQDLKQVAPYMVNSFNKNGTEYYSVDNSSMIYMLINAVKEQQSQIDELKKLVKKAD